MPNYLDGQGSSSSPASGIYGRKILGDCAGLRDGIEAGVFDVLNPANDALPRPGSKPLALHTEFAKGQANWEHAYAPNTEIVFYLMRADKGAGNMSASVGAFDNPYGNNGRPVYQNNFSQGSPSSLPMQAAEQAPQSAEFGSAVQTGPAENMQNIPTQTPMNQIAVKEKVQMLDQPVSTSAAAGPLTGLTIVEEAAVGAATQLGAAVMTPVMAAANLTKYKYSAKERTESIPASQIFFADMLQKSFNPSFDIAGPARIRGGIARGSISSLAGRMAFITNGVTNSRDMIEAINNGRIGFSTAEATLQARRLGPTALLQTTTTAPRRPYSGATTYGAA